MLSDLNTAQRLYGIAIEINYVLMPLLLFTAGAFLLQICPNNLVFTNDKFHGIIEEEDLQQLQRRSIW